MTLPEHLNNLDANVRCAVGALGLATPDIPRALTLLTGAGESIKELRTEIVPFWRLKTAEEKMLDQVCGVPNDPDDMNWTQLRRYVSELEEKVRLSQTPLTRFWD